MPALQVKDFPPDLYEELRECAAQQDRNISQQTVRILREYLQAYRQVGEVLGKADPVLPRSSGAVSCSGRVLFSKGFPDDGDMHDRIARREKIFEKIHALPRLEDSDGFLDSVELVRQTREERGCRLDFSLDDDRGCDQ